jgi:hypothetical protein
MGEVGDVLEAIHRVGSRFTNVRATIRQWSNPALGKRANGGGRPRLQIGRRKIVDDPPISVSNEAILRVWVESPTKARMEESRKIKGHDVVALRIVNGDQWVERDWNGHVRTAQGDMQKPFTLTDAERHFDPDLIRQILSQLILEAKGHVNVAGRDCIKLTGIPRAGCLLWPHWIPQGADEYEFHADPERGAILAIHSRFDGEVFGIDEVIDVEFDQALDSGLFTYEPSPGEQVRPAVPVIERLTLSQAIQRVPFTVLILGTVLEAEGIILRDVTHFPPGGRRDREQLYLPYNEVNLHIRQARTPDPEIGDFEWETIEFGGEELRISDPGQGDGKCIAIVLERLGTHVMMYSDLDREKLIRLAMTLVPATQIP